MVGAGGGLSEHLCAGNHVLDGYPPDQRCTGARGLPLTVWPNRIADGAYTIDRVDYHLTLTEPDKHNAIRGLLRWRSGTCRQQGTDRMWMGTVLHPLVGYPFALDLSVEYRLDEGGLAAHTSATCLGDRPCPYGACQHPYLFVGTDVMDSCTLEQDAARWLLTDQRGLPTAELAVAGFDHDYRDGQMIDGQQIDYTFTDLTRDAAGLVWPGSRHRTGDGSRSGSKRVTRSSRSIPRAPQPAQPRRRGLGVERMTCAPNAFRTGLGLTRLKPGQSTAARWRIRPG